MSAEEISEELSNNPGVTISSDYGQIVGQEAATTTLEPADGNSATAGDHNTPGLTAISSHADEAISSYDSSSDSELDEEPEEEYNELFKSDSNPDSNAPQSPLGKLLASHTENSELRQHFSNIRQDLFLPLRLYIMADRYDVPALRLLTRDRFYRAAEVGWVDADCFPSVVDELYSNTLAADNPMREIVCRLVATGLYDREIRDKFDSVMRKHGDFAVDVMNCYIASSRERWWPAR